MRVWVNGSLLDRPSDPVLQADDHGFTVGDGVFEAVKVTDGVPFALTRHLLRLNRSARSMGLPEPDEEQVREAVKTVLAGFTQPRGRLRITYSGGPAPMGSGRVQGAPTLVVAVAPLAPYPETSILHTVPWPRNERGALAGVKSTSYGENVVALARAAEHGAGEAIFANLAGNLCEGTGSNVFYVVDGEVRTPTLASGCLAGVTRELLLRWIDAREVDEPIEVAQKADEVFLVSTTRDVQPVSHWDGRDFAAPGPLTRIAQETWARRESENPDP